MTGKPSKRIVSWRCTSRMTRELRFCSICAIFRIRMPSSIRCLSIGCSAENMKNSQKRSTNENGMTSPIVRTLWLPSRVEPVYAFIAIEVPIAARRFAQERADNEPDQKASDMRPPGDTATGGRHEQVRRSLQDLQHEPQAGEDDGRHFEEQRDEQDGHQNDQPRER